MSVWIRHNAQLELRENVRSVTRERGLTQRELAEGAHMKQARLSSCLNQRTWFTQDEVATIAQVLEVSTIEFLGESIFRGDPSESTFDFRPLACGGTPPATPAPPPAKRKRALCCICGSLRFWSSTAGTSFVPDMEPQARMMRELTCATCRVVTQHALLRPVGDGHRDIAEQSNYAPTRGEQSRREVAELIERISAFNNHVAFRRLGRNSDDPAAVSYKWDESKSQWRFEINPCAPATVQLHALRIAWNDVASGEFKGVDWDPKKGVWITPNEKSWNSAVDDLVEDLRTQSTVERRRIADRIVSRTFDAERSE